MSSTTYEGKVINGRIQLPAKVVLPENSRVFVVVPDNAALPLRRVSSPHLVHPEQANDFVLEVEEASDASL